MAFTKLSTVPNPFIDSNGDPFAGAVLKAFLPGTTTVTSIFTDSAGSSPQATVTANATGAWEVSGNEIVPHIDRKIKWGIFANASDAASNTPFFMGPFDNIEQSLSSGSQEFDTIALAVASTSLNVGDSFTTKGYTTKGDGGDNLYEVVAAATGTPDGGTFIDLATHQAKGLFPGGVLRAQQYGIIGDNSGADYVSNWVNFMAATANFARATFPNETIFVDNSAGPVSFQSNCSYEGGKNTFIQPNTFDQRVFLTQSKTNFQIDRLRSYINEGAGGEDDTIGGGYWRFESCTEFQMFDCEVSRSFSGGIKFSLCTDFELYRTKTNYNQFNGVEIEGCARYVHRDYESSFNGKYSSDDTFKPLPTGFGGTHGGRGWSVLANGDTVDQEDSNIGNGRCVQNSEYGVRCFAASTKGIKNLSILGLETSENGAPAGTYGTVVLGADKGLDILINSDALGDSENIILREINISRSLGFGTAIAMDGLDHQLENVNITLSGDALHVAAAVAIFGGTGLVCRNVRSTGSNVPFSFGSGLPENVTFLNCSGLDCLHAINGGPNGGLNVMDQCIFEHRTTLAISGEEGMDLSTVSWEVTHTTFDGFYRGFDIITAAPIATVTDCTTTNTVDSGISGTPVTNQTGLIIERNSFDSAFPSILASFVYNRRGQQSRNRVINNAPPDTGGTGSGALMNWILGDKFESSLGTIGTPKGWICTTAGTPGTWTSTGNL